MSCKQYDADIESCIIYISYDPLVEMKTHLKSNYIGKSSSRTYVGHASEIKAVLEMQKNSQESPGVFRSFQESSEIFRSPAAQGS